MKEGRLFFFEKKKQKTFEGAARRICSVPRSAFEVFLVLFLQKKNILSFGCFCRKRGKEDSSFSEEKKAKRLYQRCAAQRLSSPPRSAFESFLLLFFKKEESSPSLLFRFSSEQSI